MGIWKYIPIILVLLLREIHLFFLLLREILLIW